MICADVYLYNRWIYASYLISNLLLNCTYYIPLKKLQNQRFMEVKILFLSEKNLSFENLSSRMIHDVL